MHRLLLPLLLLPACNGEPEPQPEPVVPFRVWSPDHETSDGMPRATECDNWLPAAFQCSNSNPRIAWEGVPEGTASLALVFDDPDAGDFPHWAIYNLDPSTGGLDAGISGEQVANTPPAGSVELDNGFGYNGYLGSCPGGTNLYRWRLFALSEDLTGPFASYDALVTAAREVRIERATECHLYGPATQ